jgi:predicted RNase H-like nuclease (RuvC/YqgF family)
MHYVCAQCADAYFDQNERQETINFTPERISKLEEHINHVEKKVDALTVEINELTKSTKEYSAGSKNDIKLLENRISMLSVQISKTNNRMDEMMPVFINMKTLFDRYSSFMSFVESKFHAELTHYKKSSELTL